MRMEQVMNEPFETTHNEIQGMIRDGATKTRGQQMLKSFLSPLTIYPRSCTKWRDNYAN